MIIKSKPKCDRQSNQEVKKEEIKKVPSKYNVVFKEEPKIEIPVIEEKEEELDILFDLLEEEE